jgi:AraC family transcriptional regulator, positive regulator of tynA and feaB
LNLPLTDSSFASQDGRTARLQRGDFTILDSSRPFELGFEADFQQISLTLPHDLLAPLLATPGDATAMRVRGDRGVGAVASGALRALAAAGGSYDRQAARSLTDQLVALVALALGGVTAPPASATRALLLQAALDEVERSLSDPDLSPSRVAERVAISTRYLHQLFSDRGTSFGRWVLARRLQRCQRDLTDSDRNHWTIAEIAGEHGFRDPSYFARAFKAHYGISPRELRRG